MYIHIQTYIFIYMYVNINIYQFIITAMTVSQ